MILPQADLRAAAGSAFRFPVFSFSTLLICILLIDPLYAQEKVVTAGIQFKPIFSSKFFNTGPENASDDSVQFQISPKSGFCIGMVIRKGITNTISFETGINFVKRNFSILVQDTIKSIKSTSDFSIIGYEIPLQGLVFIQLSDKVFMDVSLGGSLDFYPSDVQSYGNYIFHFSAKKTWVSASVLANLGWEYRTEKSGYFYLGASYHRPFEYIYTSFVTYQNDHPVDPPVGRMELQGNYLTLDIRYFFHSDPEKRKKKIKK